MHTHTQRGKGGLVPVPGAVVDDENDDVQGAVRKKKGKGNAKGGRGREKGREGMNKMSELEQDLKLREEREEKEEERRRRREQVRVEEAPSVREPGFRV